MVRCVQWSKGKVREKKNYRVVYNNETYQKMIKEVPRKMKVITTYSLVEAYKITGSLVYTATQPPPFCTTPQPHRTLSPSNVLLLCCAFR